jgi:hypothetical protein
MPSSSSNPNALTGPSHTSSPPLEHAMSPTSTHWKPRTSIETLTAPHIAEICLMHPSTCQMNPQPRCEHHPPTTMSHHPHSKHRQPPKKTSCPHPSHSAWCLAKPPCITPPSLSGPPPTYSTMHGPPMAPPDQCLSAEATKDILRKQDDINKAI